MRYEKPKIEIEKFYILDEIMEGGTSAGSIVIDEDNDDVIIIETMGKALSNIFDIN